MLPQGGRLPGPAVLVACVLFAQRIAHLVDVTRVLDHDGTVRYSVDGALFFGAATRAPAGAGRIRVGAVARR